MKKFINKIILIFYVLLGLQAFAESTPVENLYQYKLNNGLEVFAVENHTVPLVYIEIVFKTGAIHHTKDNAGLFHLYEHMMFEGNVLYPSEGEFQKAMNNLGVSFHNGSTSFDSVCYYFSIPSYKLEEGLAFWNAAIRSPLMKEQEFEAQKKIVVSEIAGEESSRNHQLFNYISAQFSNEPYKHSVGGSVDIIENATISQLAEIKNTYYIPCNAGLFVGGDINPEEVKNLAEKIFGDWSNNGHEKPEKSDYIESKKLDKIKYAVIPEETVSPQSAEIGIYYKMPNLDRNPELFTSMQYLQHILAQPDGFYKKEISKIQSLKVPGPEYVYSGITSYRISSLFYAGTGILEPQSDIPSRAVEFAQSFNDIILQKLLKDSSIGSAASVRNFVTSEEDDEIESRDTAEQLISQLKACWVLKDAELYYNYIEECGKLNKKAFNEFLSEYLNTPPVVIAFVNPELYSQTKTDFEEKGFEEISSDNAFWWKKKEFSRETSIASAETYTLEENLYTPDEKNNISGTAENSSPLTVSRLKNGIPVYIYPTNSRIVSASINVKGGVLNLTKETEGLERVLFDVMASSSKKCSYENRRKLCYKNNISIWASTKFSGTSIFTKTIDKNFDVAVNLLTDGFLNPVCETDFFKKYKKDTLDSIHAKKNNPESVVFELSNREFYKNHPYGISTSVTEESYDAITPEAVMEHHKKILAENEIFVCVSGKIDTKKLITKLNKSLGAIKYSPKYKGINPATENIPLVQIPEAEPVVIRLPNSAGTATAIETRALCSSSQRDFTVAGVASSIYSDILYKVVREKYGACYSPVSRCTGCAASSISTIIYRISDMENFAKYTEEARQYMLAGTIPEQLNSDGSFSFVTVDDILELYKNKFFTSEFAQKSHTSDITYNMSYNIMQFNDYDHDIKTSEIVRSITAGEILDIFKKYWTEESRWFAVTGPEENLSF